MGNVNPFSLEDDSLRRRGYEAQRSGFPRMQVSSSSSRFYVKATRSGGGRRYFREAYSNGGDYSKPVIKSRYIPRNSDSTRHLIQHVDYMMKSKIDREREPEVRKLFDRDGREITRDEGIEKALGNQTYDIAGHKLILSPGDNNVDMVEYTRDQMRVLEERFNARIDYSFSYQKNTDHYHIHVNLPARAERRLDFGAEADGGKVDIRLGRDDFAAMREAGQKYLSDYNFVDHLTDKRVAEDLLRDWFGEGERLKQNTYNARARRELGIEMTQADVDALRELGIEVPFRGSPRPKFHQAEYKETPHIERDGAIKDELAKYLLDRSAKFETEWSERDISRLLLNSERDPEWIFPHAYRNYKNEREDRAAVIESLSKDSRFTDFVRNLELHLNLRQAEHAAERLKSGLTKGEFISHRQQIEQFFSEGAGSLIYEKVSEVQESLETRDGRDPDLFSELNGLMDRHLLKDAERLNEKYNLPVLEDGEQSGRSISMQTHFKLTGRTEDLQRLMRTLKYKSSGNFVDSFERLVNLHEGADSTLKYKTVEERNYLLAERLMNPEYSDERENMGLLQDRAFQLYSRFSSKDSLDSTKESIRDSQFALDSKILNLDKERLGDEAHRKKGIHERNADAQAHNYREAQGTGNERDIADAAQKYHASVMRFDDDRRRDEHNMSVNYEQERGMEVPAGDLRQTSEHNQDQEVGYEDLEHERGPSLPLPGYGLERLERDSGDSMADPSEIQVELTREELNRRRSDDDDEEHERSKL